MSPLRVGIAGAGHISTSHIKAWRGAAGCSVAAIMDLHQETAEKQARLHRIERVAGSQAELLECCDVIDVCTPPHAHAQLLVAAAQAGRHLLVEKPVVIDLDEWQRVRQAVEANQVELAVVHNIKFSRSVQLAKKWLDEGRIGRLLRLRREFLTHPSKDRMLEGAAHWSHALPGGRWLETLPHELYLIHWLAAPLALNSVTALRTPTAPNGVPADEVSLVLSGADVVATIHFSANCRQNRRVLELIGSTGRIHVDLLSDSAMLFRAGDRRWRRAAGHARLEALATVGGWMPDRVRYLLDRAGGRTPHRRLIDAFARHLQGRGPTPTPLDEIDYVVRVGAEISHAIEHQASVATGNDPGSV